MKDHVVYFIRRHPYRFVIGLLYLAAMPGSWAGERSQLVQQLAQGKSQVVVAYGTSLTANGAWVGQVNAALDQRFPGVIKMVNSGGSGKWSDWGVKHLDARVIQHRPNTVFIEFAINDSVARFEASVDVAQVNLETMIRRIRRVHPSCEIILMTMTPGDKYPPEHRSHRKEIEAHYRMVRAVSRDLDLMLIDHYPNWRALELDDPMVYKQYVPDTIHPTALGCEKIVTPLILKSLGIAD